MAFIPDDGHRLKTITGDVRGDLIELCIEWLNEENPERALFPTRALEHYITNYAEREKEAAALAERAKDIARESHSARLIEELRKALDISELYTREANGKTEAWGLRIQALRETLSQCADWFQECGYTHKTKGEAQKANRDYHRARVARAALGGFDSAMTQPHPEEKIAAAVWAETQRCAKHVADHGADSFLANFAEALRARTPLPLKGGE